MCQSANQYTYGCTKVFIHDKPNKVKGIEADETNYNVTLSKNRAEAVVSYLMKKGIDRTRLEIKYFGATKPATTNDSDEGRAKNRRVEFIIIK